MDAYRSEILKQRKIKRLGQAFIEESAKLISLLGSLDESPHSNLKRYPIHGDITPENLIWKNNKLVGLIDFEHVSGTNEPAMKDIAVTLQFVCRDKKLGHQLDLGLARQFIQSYIKWHSISGEEVRVIPDLVASGFVEDFVWAYWMLTNDPVRASPYALKQISTAAQWSHSNRERIAQALLN